MISKYLTIYKHPFELVRLGRNYDGGYIIPKELINDELLSFGICNDISFEKDYYKSNPNANIIAFDHTIQSLPENVAYINWNKIAVKENDSDDNTELSLNSIIEKYHFKNFNIKMDIEADEYPVFKSISTENLKNINCLILEVHWIDTLTDNFYELMDHLSSELVLIHRHDNRCGGYFNYNNETLARVYELTFVNKKYITTDLVENDISLPIDGLDFPN